MEKLRYLKYYVPSFEIKKILANTNKRKINFFLDLQSICKGLYNSDNIFYELNYYIENERTFSRCLLNELKTFLNNLYKEYKFYNPFFFIFYDDGISSQNKDINSNYKNGRSLVRDLLVSNNDHLMLYYEIKKQYFNDIEKLFTKQNVSKVFYLKQYESDLIPYFCIDKNLEQSKDDNTLNVVLSVDKDLLQCCGFHNTVQVTNRFLPKNNGSKRFATDIFNNENALSYIYKLFKPGILTARHIPLILSIAGDTADNIKGVIGLGNKRAMDLIQNFNLPDDLSNFKKMKDELPEILKVNFDLICRNMEIIDFREQISRTSILKEQEYI